MSFTVGSRSLLQLNQQLFDFNPQFEHVFFSIIPSALFIVSSLWRTLHQWRKPAIIYAPIFQLVKLVSLILYSGIRLSLLILVANGSLHETPVSIVSTALNFVVALFMISTSVIDHSRSPRPSLILNCYLFLTLLLDIARTRTGFLLSEDGPESAYSIIFATSLALNVVILLLESYPKTQWVNWDEKKHSPEETSGIFSLGLLFWMNSMFLKGFNKTLTADDLYPLDTRLDTNLVHKQFSRNINYTKLKGDKYGLLKVLVRTLKAYFLLPVIPRLAQLGFTFAQPFFIEKLLDYLAEGEVPANVGYGFIGASILIYSGIAISTALCMYPHHRMRAMVRSILVTETFIKATKLGIGADDRSAAVTLMSTDIERIKLGFRMIHNVWAGVIQAVLASWMLYIRLGPVFAAPIGLVTVCFALLGILLSFTEESQKAWMAKSQKRVGLTAAVVANMKNLKIAGLSSTIGSFIQQLRIQELAAGAQFRKILILAAICGFTPMLLGPPLTIGLSPNSLDTKTVFSSLSFLVLLTNPLSMIFQSLPEIMSGLVCIGRIQAFLECENRDDFRRIFCDRASGSEPDSFEEMESLGARNCERVSTSRRDNANDYSTSQAESDNPAILIKDANFGWEKETLALRNINLRITKSSLTMVVGPVASGKSTLCKALLGETPFSEGSVALGKSFHRHVGFCDQAAFIHNGTIRENIIGFSHLDPNRYAEVIKATALTHDLEKLPLADNTIVGSDGVMLSGGQKQRISLARALYLQTDLLVLDDIFSGLDADTEQEVFRLVFGAEGLLRRRQSTVILCTHSIKYLPAADHVVVLEDGSITEQGDYDSLNSRPGYVQSLGVKISSGNVIKLPKEAKSTTTIEIEESRSQPLDASESALAALEIDADPTLQVGEREAFKEYFSSMSWRLVIFCLFFSVLWGFFTNFPTVWLSFWTSDLSTGYQTHSRPFYVGIYFFLQIAAMLSLLLLGIAIFIISVKRAGANLHQDILTTLIHVALHFITNTDAGVIVNLFSQDLNLIDTELPEALLNTLFCVFQAIGQAAVLLASSLWLAISYPFLIAGLYAIQKFYLRTSRQLRLLDLETKSPLYTHFIDTLKGIATLRAFGFISEDLTKNARLLDASQRPAYLLVMVQEWLNLVLDLLVMVLATILTVLAVKLHSSAGFTGASLFTLLSLGENLSGFIIYYTKLETSIGAIGRLKTFNKTAKSEEKDSEDVFPDVSWPQYGAVELKGVSASYGKVGSERDANCHLALNNLHLTIKPREKVAICGRTGSGKSSLIALLLKILDPLPTSVENVTIDGVLLHRIDRPTLRSRIIAVPQETVFLPDGSSFKDNLDPTGESTREECEAAFAAVGLSTFIQERGGIDAGLTAGTFSAGQRQLMSLSRAVLRCRLRTRQNASDGGGGTSAEGGGILLLDEVSSSVDAATERTMRETIRTEFKTYTVIAISHRLDMIRDFDTVVVMDAGQIVEMGNPRLLAGDASTRFGTLVNAGIK